MSFDQKAKETRRNAVKFLKQVTSCTTRGQRGHWQGDDECLKKHGGKGSGHLKKKSVSLKKKPASNLFVLDEGIEQSQEQGDSGQYFVGEIPEHTQGIPESYTLPEKFHDEQSHLGS